MACSSLKRKYPFESTGELSVVVPDVALQPVIKQVEKCFRDAFAVLELMDAESHLIDRISMETFQYPVVLSCGCVYSAKPIQEWLKRATTCPIRHPVDKKMKRCALLNRLVEKEIQKLVLTCEGCAEENPLRAKKFLEQAREWLEGESPDYNAALDLYHLAFQWTKSSVDYREVVELYNKMGMEDRAECAKVYLATLQLKENRVLEAIETLEACTTAVIQNSLVYLKAFAGSSDLFRCAISEEEWGDMDAVRARAPWPQELVQVWDALSQEEKGQYMVFPIPSRLAIDGEIVPCTYQNIECIVKTKDAACPGVFILDDVLQEEELPEEREIQWAIMKKTVLEGNRFLTYAEEAAQFQEWIEEREDRQGFEIPLARDLFFAFFWRWQESLSRERLYSNTCVISKEKLRDSLYQMTVGYSSAGAAHSMFVTDGMTYLNRFYCGVIPMRKF